MAAHDQRRIFARALDVGFQFRKKIGGHAVGVARMRVEMVKCERGHWCDGGRQASACLAPNVRVVVKEVIHRLREQLIAGGDAKFIE